MTASLLVSEHHPPQTDHVIEFGATTPGKTIIMGVSSAAVQSMRAPWVDLGTTYATGPRLFGPAAVNFFMFPGSANWGITSAVIHQAASRGCSVVAWEDDVDASTIVFKMEGLGPTAANPSLSGTGGFTFTQRDEAVAFFTAVRTTSFNFDIVSYDTGFVELADSGAVTTIPNEATRIWIAKHEDIAFTSQGVTATWDANRAASVTGGAGGLIAYNHAVATAPASPLPPAGTKLSIHQENLLGPSNTDLFTVTDIGDLASAGFARKFSLNVGDTQQFSCIGPGSIIRIYRLGDYEGGGVRFKSQIVNTPVVQPTPDVIPDSNGSQSCENWSVTASWVVPAIATPGLYVAVHRNAADTNGFHMVFVVRDDGRPADVMLKISDATWALAYNYYGSPGGSAETGKSWYGSGGPMGDIATRAHRSTYMRPVITRKGVIQTYYRNAELPLIRYLERLGLNITYSACRDWRQHASAPTLASCKIYISSGHDEYWDQGMNDKWEALRSAGKHLLFMSGNERFWRIRYEDDGDAAWCYKDTMRGPGSHPAGQPLDPVTWTGTWKDTRWEDREPENKLTGTDFRLNGLNQIAMTIDSGDPITSHPFWRHTTLATDGISCPVIGFEADEVMPTMPDGSYAVLGRTVFSASGNYADDNGEDYTLSKPDFDWGIVSQRMYSGGLVVGFGTCQWAWGLDGTHDRGSDFTNISVQQATYNLLRDLGAAAAPVLFSGLTEPTPVANLDAYGEIPDPPGPEPIDSVPITDSVTVVRTGLPTAIHASADVSDSLLTTSASVSIPVAEDLGQAVRTIRTSLLRDRVMWGSVATPYRGPSFDTSSGGSRSVGLPFWVIRSCRLVGCRIYKAPELAGNIVVQVWSPSGVELHRETVFWTADEGGWRDFEFAQPILLDASPDVVSPTSEPIRTSLKRYTISYFSPNSWIAHSDYVWQVFNWTNYPIRVEYFGDRTGVGLSGGSLIDSMPTPGLPTAPGPANFYIDPIVEWDDNIPGYNGGTRYYEQWKNGPRDDRFPFGVFFADPPFLEDYASVGINYLQAGNATPDYIAALKDNNIYHIPSVENEPEPVLRAMAQDPAYAALVKAYYILDEPDQYAPYTPPDQMLAWKQKIRRYDSTRPLFMGMGRVVGLNNTYYHQPQGATLDFATKLWRGWAQLSDIVSGDFYTLSDNDGRAEGWGPWTYGAWTRRLRGLVDDRYPAWCVVETTSQTEDQPIPSDVHGAIWSALIAGAKGIIIFDHRFGEGLIEKDFAAMLHDPPMRAMITALTPIIQSLRFALFAPEADLVTDVDVDDVISTATGPTGGYGIGAKVPMAYTTRVVGGTTYLFAMTDRPGRVNATFKIPTAANKSITVIGEGRSLTANSQGVFTDAFLANDYMVHLYSWPSASASAMFVSRADSLGIVDSITASLSTPTTPLNAAPADTLGLFDAVTASLNPLEAAASDNLGLSDAITAALTGSSAGAFPSSSLALIDNFNRTNAHALWEDAPFDTVWSAGAALGGGSGVWACDTGFGIPFNTGANILSLFSLGPDFDFTLDVAEPPNPGGYIAIFFCCQSVSTGSWEAYWLIIDTAGTWLLRKRVAGSITTIATGSGSVPLLAGDKIGIRRSGTDIEAYLYRASAWTLQASVTDSSITVGGPIALEAAPSPPGNKYDNLSGVNL